MAILNNSYDSALRVTIAENAAAFVPCERKRTQFTKETLLQTQWFNHVPSLHKSPLEFRATPIENFDMPEGFPTEYLPSDYPRSSWYFLEKCTPERNVPNEYVVHGDNLLPVNAKYPDIISMLPHLQEILALAQLEAAKLSQKPELRLDVADRLMVHLRTIGVNVQNFTNKS